MIDQMPIGLIAWKASSKLIYIIIMNMCGFYLMIMACVRQAGPRVRNCNFSSHLWQRHGEKWLSSYMLQYVRPKNSFYPMLL